MPSRGWINIMVTKERAPRNRTITLIDEDRKFYKNLLRKISVPVKIDEIIDSTICQDTFTSLRCLPDASIDLIFADPPYNLTKDFNGNKFKQISLDDYESWLNLWLPHMKRLLKPKGAIYLCGDWRSSSPIQRSLSKLFVIRNRITWEREKGRGAKKDWKNNAEDIWYATVSDDYTFNIDDVKIKRRVIAPYTDENGKPKDWESTNSGKYRITHPSNIWTDVTVPFWSMPENTDHPTQKPEKLLAKIILASTNPGDIVFDPFLGSGTTSVTAKKLSRHYVGIEIDEEYCCLAEKRLYLANNNKNIQGYTDGVFWERNSLSEQVDGNCNQSIKNETQQALFDIMEMSTGEDNIEK